MEADLPGHSLVITYQSCLARSMRQSDGAGRRRAGAHAAGGTGLRVDLVSAKAVDVAVAAPEQGIRLLTCGFAPTVVLDQYAVHCCEHRPDRARNLRPPGTAESAPAHHRSPGNGDTALGSLAGRLTSTSGGRKQVLSGLTHEYYIAALPPTLPRKDAGHPAESHFRAPQGPAA
jgi:hypothetical protein